MPAAVAAWYRSWGLTALVLVGGAGYAWYRAQVDRAAETEKFFGDPGEETRLTGFQAGGSPSEMPPEPPAVMPPGRAQRGPH